MKNFKFIPATLVVAVSLASGCSTYTDKRETDSLSADMGRSTRDQISRSVNSVTLDAKRAAQEVNRPYITGKAIPLAREVTLPSPLRANVNTTLMFRDPGSLPVMASRIQEATGIPVKVMPDALLPAEYFMPRLENQQMMGGGAAAMAFARPTAAPIVLDSPLPGVGAPAATPSSAATSAAPSAPASKRDYDESVKRESMPLATSLDAIAMREGVYWKYDDTLGAIVFYRTETRTFEIRGAEMNATSEMTVDLTGGMDSTSSSGLASKSKSGLDLPKNKESTMQSLVLRVTQFTTKSGRVVAGSGGLLVVTDTKSVLDQIAEFIRQENTMRSRMVDMVLEQITLENTTSSNAAANWNLMFKSGGQGNGVNVDGLNSIIEQEGAALTLGASVGSGQWAGSSIALQALSKVGKVVDQKVNHFGSVNGQPATAGRPQREKYIDKLEQTATNSDINRPTVTATQAEEVSGRIITVLPNAYSDGDINLAIKYDDTPTPVFTKQQFPDGSYVQSPKSESDVLVRSAIVRSGQPYVISAQTVDNSTYNERRTDRSAPMLLGGSDVANKTERMTVLVLTARVREK
ncbi:hypothetical protein [Pseudomonas sp. EMN2]|uniref:hypothetical protein n=1 Tax=Pseudomonas sp. EMN2 TaxID=2615212 RepID=UPI00129A186A|nr:hypothetical protein [Pseudomonas sp. EMN2]